MTDTELIRYTVKQTIDAVLKEKGIRVKSIRNKVLIGWAARHYGISRYSIEKAIKSNAVRFDLVGGKVWVYREDVEKHFDLK